MTRKLIVLGFDGMDPAGVEKAEMPNLDRLRDQGGHGLLRSTNPPVTCPAWPSYMTGKDPARHQVYDFAYLDEERNVCLNEYENVHSPTLIDVMDETDRPALFFEIPLTYPAPDGKSIVISGYPSENVDRKFNPSPVRKEIESELGSFPSVSPIRFTGDNRDETLRELFEATEYRKNAFKYLLETKEWTFATINFHLPDQAGHYFWDEFEENPDDNALVDAYEFMDEKLGELLETIDETTNLMIMSDHGHGTQEQSINLNYFLLREGFLKLKNSPGSLAKKLLTRAGLSPARIKDFLDRNNLTRFLPDFGRKQRDALLDKFLTYRDMDWERSEAFAFGHVGQIYWIGNDSSRREELREKLNGLTHDGEALVDEIIPLRSETNDPEPSEEKPLWLLKMNDWASIAYPLFLGKWGLAQKPNDAGCHRPDGIISWRGPDFTSLEESIHGHITDVAPTVHRLLGIPPQADFDGEVLEQILGEDAPEPKEPKHYGRSESTDDDRPNEERVEQLKNLGYL